MGKKNKPPVPVSSNWAQLQSKLKSCGNAASTSTSVKKPTVAGKGDGKPHGFKGKGKRLQGGGKLKGGSNDITSAPPPKSQPPRPFKASKPGGVLMPGDADYDSCLRAAYDGFVLDGEEALPGKLRARVAAALQAMSDSDMFHYDIVSAGSRVSATFCQRVLLGDEGMTYHYQKLR